MEIQIISHYLFWYILITLIGVAVGVISYRSSFPPLGQVWRVFLAVLRSAMVILIGIFLIQPVLNFYSSKTIKPQLAVLVDVSKSMSVEENGKTRIAKADSLTRNALSSVKGNYRIFDFATDLRDAGDLPSESELTGDATSIANALQEFSARKDIDAYGALLVVTDGKQNLGEDPAEVGAKLNMPVYTLTVGENLIEKNLAVENVMSPSIAYSGAEFKVETELSGSGLPAGKSRIFLKLGPSVVAEKPFDIPQENRKVRVSFDVKAPEPGNYEYTVSTPVLPDESNKIDNERVFAVRVLKSKLKIFLGTSSLTWEFKFVKQALEKSQGFDVDAVYPTGSGSFSVPGTPRGPEGLSKYDIIFLVNSSPGGVRIASPDLKKYVGDGGSLIYLAGNDSPSDIRLFDDLLPFKIEKPGIFVDEFFFEPVPTRKQHAAILLNDDPDESGRIWRSLPPFDDAVTGVTPTGDVLLEGNLSLQPASERTRSAGKGGQDTFPILTVGSYGNGRVAVVTGFPWWKSYFGATRETNIANAIPDFWQNLVKWSSTIDQKQNFRILTDRKVYRLGEPVRLTGYLYDESSRPKNGAYISVSIIPQGRKTSIKEVVLPPVDNGVYAENVTSLAPGHYGFRATATSFGDTLGRATGELTIESYSLEMASSAPDYSLTSQISEATGGVAYTEADFGKFPEQVKLTPYVKENEASVKPFGMPVFLIVLLAGLCLEWGLRKRFRLP